jgi:hypothetical protein
MSKMNARFPKFATITWPILGLVLLASMVRIEAAPQKSNAAAQVGALGVAVDADDIGGVVTSANGPEAGVWVIAETTDFKTKFRKIVVTDDRGRYLLPDLPKANYKLWVRGYGLLDSKPVDAALGKNVALAAVLPPTPQAAAQYYPPNYWLSLLQIPPKSAFPMTIPGQTIQTQADYYFGLKRGCEVCHQMGNKATREIEPEIGSFSTVKDAWERKLQVGQGGLELHGPPQLGLHNPTAMGLWVDWEERIAKGELPPTPPRPQGIERNLVLTMWDFANRTAFPHDVISTDRWKPTDNANGRLYIVDWGEGAVSVVDPVENAEYMATVPLRNEEWRKILPSAEPDVPVKYPSPYWGKELTQVRHDNMNAGPGMMDSKGRTWFNIQTRPDVPSFCLPGSNNRFARYYPMKQVSLERLRNQAAGVAYFDTKTEKFTIIDICFGASHVAFGHDKDETLYFTARGVQGIGWINTRVWDETHDAEKSQGWCPAVLDYNGDGKIGPFTKANEPPNPKLDRMVTDSATGYTIAANPRDGSVWYQINDVPGKIVRVDVGASPPQTCMAEAYEPPFDPTNPNKQTSFDTEGIDIDSNGIVWVGLYSGQLASFDRSKCKVRNGPTATGQHCPEGWTMYPVPGPKLKGTDVAADYFYNDWVDRDNTLGLGNDVPMLNGTGSDSLIAYLPDTKKWVTMRVPYPMGFYTRSLDGRIDDPKGEWKGRGVWAAVETRVVWHTEGGWGTRPYVVHFQMRPEPLAK